MPPSNIRKDDSLLPYARRLRREMTPHERKLWYLFLRPYPVKVYKQRIIGSYIADFYCAAAKLVVEVDGSQHYADDAEEYDRRRTRTFAELGLLVLRFGNHEIDRDFAAVCDRIDQTVRARLGSPSGDADKEAD